MRRFWPLPRLDLGSDPTGGLTTFATHVAPLSQILSPNSTISSVAHVDNCPCKGAISGCCWLETCDSCEAMRTPSIAIRIQPVVQRPLHLVSGQQGQTGQRPARSRPCWLGSAPDKIAATDTQVGATAQRAARCNTKSLPIARAGAHRAVKMIVERRRWLPKQTRPIPAQIVIYKKANCPSWLTSTRQ